MSAVMRNPIEEVLESIEVPSSSYEVAVSRYKDLGEWLHDASKAKCAVFDPQVSVQGSFRLGTAIRPLGSDSYDLDLVCNLTSGITPLSHSQFQLKSLLGVDLEAYRRERQIQDALEERNRCWRLEYQDSLSFHMDALPAVPLLDERRQAHRERMVLAGALPMAAGDWATSAIAITDRRRPEYKLIDPQWPSSNPEGFAKWFESRMRLAKAALSQRAMSEHVASIEALPVYRWKTPLQRATQFLKRHRDVMFQDDPDRKPISVIITTLGGKTYHGETDVESALRTILAGMKAAVSPTTPRVPNPVNPKEDFADKWSTAEGRRLRLEQNFVQWVDQAQLDFDLLARAANSAVFEEQASRKFGIGKPSERASSPATRVQILSSAAPRPWRT
jgi:hypothetical protein